MKEPPKNILNIDAGTIVLIISVIILLPLVLTGFLALLGVAEQVMIQAIAGEE